MKVASLRMWTHVFGCLWATSPPLLASTIVLHLSPHPSIFLLWIPKLIVDRLVAVCPISRTEVGIWKLLALEFASPC